MNLFRWSVVIQKNSFWHEKPRSLDYRDNSSRVTISVNVPCDPKWQDRSLKGTVIVTRKNDFSSKPDNRFNDDYRWQPKKDNTLELWVTKRSKICLGAKSTVWFTSFWWLASGTVRQVAPRLTDTNTTGTSVTSKHSKQTPVPTVYTPAKTNCLRWNKNQRKPVVRKAQNSITYFKAKNYHPRNYFHLSSESTHFQQKEVEHTDSPHPLPIQIHPLRKASINPGAPCAAKTQTDLSLLSFIIARFPLKMWPSGSITPLLPFGGSPKNLTGR